MQQFSITATPLKHIIPYALIAVAVVSFSFGCWYTYKAFTFYNTVYQTAKDSMLKQTETTTRHVLDLLQQAPNAIMHLQANGDRHKDPSQALKKAKSIEISGLGYATIKNGTIEQAWCYFEQADQQRLISSKEDGALLSRVQLICQLDGFVGPIADPCSNQNSFICIKQNQDEIFWATQSIEHIAHLLNTTQTQAISYWLLLDKNHVVQFAPFDELEQKTMSQVASHELIPNQALEHIVGQSLDPNTPILVQSEHDVPGTDLWVTAQALAPVDALLMGVFSEGDLKIPRNMIRKSYFKCIIAFAIAIILALFAAMFLFWSNRTLIWCLDLSIAATCIVAIVSLWYVTNAYPAFNTEAIPIYSKAQLYRYLDKHSQSKDPQSFDVEIVKENLTNSDDIYYLLNYRYKEGTYIPTGILINDLSFEGSDKIGVVGYIWQRYFDKIHDGISRGFFFPQIGSTPDIEEISRVKINNVETILWQVSIELNQQISYYRYPFDVKNLQIRIRHQEFEKNILLVPDLDAYYLLNPGALPGVSHYTHLSNWSLVGSFFGFNRHRANTNYGIYSYGPYGVYYALDSARIPSLSFNVAAKRDIWDALIKNLLMVSIIYFILFVLLITYMIQGFGWTLGTCASNFFSTILAQIQFRSAIPSHEIVYFESFYFVLYATIVVLLALSLVSLYTNKFDITRYQDHFFVKLAYWPCTLGSLLALTVMYLY